MNTDVMGSDNVSQFPDSYTVMQDIALQKDEASYVPKLMCDSHHSAAIMCDSHFNN